MASDVGPLARRALDELHLLFAAACIFDVLRSAHFNLAICPELNLA